MVASNFYQSFRITDYRKAINRVHGKCLKYNSKAITWYEVVFINDDRHCISIRKKSTLRKYLLGSIKNISRIYFCIQDTQCDCTMFALNKKTLKPTGWMR
jgi:hypothetical protein